MKKILRWVRISEDMIPALYNLSKKVFEGEISEKEAVEQLVLDEGMNASSAKDYVRAFRCMCEGRRFTRGNNAYSVQYYIDNIHKDYGDRVLFLALDSLMQHIQYTEGVRKVTMRQLREIYDKYRKELMPISEQGMGVVVDEKTEDEIPFRYIKKLKEGAKKIITVNAYERNEKAKEVCKSHWGTVCSVCSFDFGTYYGAMGEGYIHVHHLTPLSEIGLSYEVDPVKDLRPVCPNCHAMLHRGNETMSIEELQKIILKGTWV